MSRFVFVLKAGHSSKLVGVVLLLVVMMMMIKICNHDFSFDEAMVSIFPYPILAVLVSVGLVARLCLSVAVVVQLLLR